MGIKPKIGKCGLGGEDFNGSHLEVLSVNGPDCGRFVGLGLSEREERCDIWRLGPVQQSRRRSVVPHKREPLQYVVVLREVLKILMSLSLEGKQCVPFGRPDIVSDVPDPGSARSGERGANSRQNGPERPSELRTAGACEGRPEIRTSLRIRRWRLPLRRDRALEARRLRVLLEACRPVAWTASFPVQPVPHDGTAEVTDRN